mmetsp:Transcript_11468/g.26544  ORF Transcript_11468/g.26544 Transcript_11468/m.26544 type:complete len:527 (-) Transcript_11468:233-1813(-)
MLQTARPAMPAYSMSPASSSRQTVPTAASGYAPVSAPMISRPSASPPATASAPQATSALQGHVQPIRSLTNAVASMVGGADKQAQAQAPGVQYASAITPAASAQQSVSVPAGSLAAPQSVSAPVGSACNGQQIVRPNLLQQSMRLRAPTSDSFDGQRTRGRADTEQDLVSSIIGSARWQIQGVSGRAMNALGNLTSGGDLCLYQFPCADPGLFTTMSQRLLAGFPRRYASMEGGQMQVWTSTDYKSMVWIPEAPRFFAPPHPGHHLSPVAVVVKGHIRTSLANSQLHDMLLTLKQRFAPRPTHLYIETWDWTEAKKSWRALDAQRTATDRKQLEAYFADFNVKSLNINREDAAPGQLRGSTEGVVGASKAPKFNWKHWIYLLWTGTQSVARSGIEYGAVIQTRFDWQEERVRQWMQTPQGQMWEVEEAIEAVQRAVAMMQPKCMAFMTRAGCDNLFVGHPQACALLADKLHNHLDEVIAVAPNFPHQEQYVLLAADELARRENPQGGNVRISVDPVAASCNAVWSF